MVKRKIVFRRKKRENRLSMLLVTMVVLMVLAVVSITKTRKYVEEVAKDKLGLVYDGEIIFKPEN